jgi:hypothetical protein
VKLASWYYLVALSVNCLKPLNWKGWVTLHMSDLSRLMPLVAVSLAIWLIALALGYLWVRAMRYPFTQRQRKMWWYYALVMSAIPVLNPLMAAMAWWLLPLKTSVEITISLLVTWMIIAFYAVRRMSRPGGRLGPESQN